MRARSARRGIVGGIVPWLGISSLPGVREEFNSIEIKCAVTNGRLDSDRLGRFGGTKLDFNPRSYGAVRDGKQSNAACAQIDAQGIHVPAIGEDAHVGVEP